MAAKPISLRGKPTMKTIALAKSKGKVGILKKKPAAKVNPDVGGR